MFTIGDFARHGRVSVRMLRHYDAIGLLRPAHVDTATGYRSYRASQLAALNRIVALKDLGFTLRQVAEIVDEQVSAAELRGMLRLRRSELAERIAADSARLAQVDARLRVIETEGHMPTVEVKVKAIPAARVAELTGAVTSLEPTTIGPVIGPLYSDLYQRLEAAGWAVTGPPVAYYEVADDGSVIVHAATPVAAATRPGELEIVDLPAVDAATIVHRGKIDDIVSTAQTLARWVDADGRRASGHHRELYLETPQHRDGDWVVELQEPIAS